MTVQISLKIWVWCLMVLVYIFNFITTFHQKKVIKKNMFSRVEISIRQFWNLYLTSKLYKIQYLHLFPFNCNTSTHLFCIESISFLRVSDGILFQYSLMQEMKVSLSSNWCLFLYTLLDKIPHKFSIGFKSGNLVGQSKLQYFLF